MFSSQVSTVPQGVVPPAQLFSMPSTCAPAGSDAVRIQGWPAAGPRIAIGVLAVMRRFSRGASTGFQPSGPAAISTMLPPWAAISTATCSAVTRALAWEPLPMPGKIRLVLVYSWLAQRMPCRPTASPCRSGSTAT